jgi:urease subunit gamma/beta
MPGVASLIGSVSVEAVFDDGRRLVVVDFPTSADLNVPGQVVRLEPTRTGNDSTVVAVDVTNTASIGISVTTHFHFFEVNPRLHFDRALAYGMRLAIPTGEHIDFEPGKTQSVNLVPISGERVVIGFAGLVDGPLDAPGAKERALKRAQELGYMS